MGGFNKNHLENLVYVLSTFENCKLSSKINVLQDVLTIDGEATKLYLKIVNRELRITHVNLRNRRVGTFTKLILMLNSIAHELELSSLVIEDVFTEDMFCFCSKNGFNSRNDNSFVRDVI